MSQATLESNNGVYTISSIDDAAELLKSELVHRRYAIPAIWITHLNRDYTSATGVARLGYSVLRNVVLVQPRGRERPEAELLIQCEQGYLSREEAIGLDWLPTPSEIAEAAKSIRDTNDANGDIRRSDTVGFDLGRVVQTPLYMW